MASQLLKELLAEAILSERLENWLRDIKSEPQQYNLLGEGVRLTQCEFAVYFINRIRTETLGYIESRKSCQCQKRMVEKGILMTSQDKEAEALIATKSPEKCPLETVVEPQLLPYSEKYEEYFPELGSKNKCFEKSRRSCIDQSTSNKSNKKGRRRVKPTEVNSLNSVDKGNGIYENPGRELETNVSTFTDSEIGDGLSNFDCERELLSLECNVKNNDITDIEPTSSRPANVTNKIKQKRVLLMCDVYCVLLNTNLVASLSDEIKYVLRLFLLQSCECTKKESVHINDTIDEIPLIFETIDHCNIFSVNVIDKNFSLFWCLDNYCIKMLSSNEIINSYDVHLAKKINNYYMKRVDNSNKFIIPSHTASNMITSECGLGVRKCFPSGHSFHLFGKQRDRFYKIHTSYLEQFSEDKVHLWNGSKFESDVRSLVELCQNPINFCHLASLFVDQCIHSCMKQELDEQAVPYFIEGIDHCKLLQLSIRLVRPLVSVNANEDPVNRKEEQFFSNFICSVNNNLLFMTSLMQTILKMITQLTSEAICQFEIGDVESSELSMKLLMIHHKLLLLGRLLGKCIIGSDQYDGGIREELIALHSQALHPVNLVMWLQKAIDKGALALTIPWIVESLLLLDSVKMHDPQIKTALQSLLFIYKALTIKNDKSYENLSERLIDFDCEIKNYDIVLLKLESCAFDEIEVSPLVIHDIRLTECTALLIRLWIGKLFIKSNNLSVYSESLFYTLLSSGVSNGKDLFASKKNSTLDSANVINQYILYKYCPHLHELNHLFSQSNSNLVSSFRRITPLKISQSFSNDNINVQMQLEESFFNAQKGLKSTIDFIVDRIAKVCKGIINDTILETEKRKLIQSVCLKSKPSKEEIAEINTVLLKQIETSVNDVIAKHGQTSIPLALQVLLPFEKGSSIITSCEKIATRKLKQQITTWLNFNIANEEDYVEKVLANAIKKKLTTLDPLIITNLEEPVNNGVYFSNELLQLQEMLEMMVLKASTQPKYEDVVLNLEALFKNVHITSLSPKILSEIHILTWDFTIVLVTNFPEFVTDELLELMCNFWTQHHSGDLEKRILCARNIYMASKCSNHKTVSTLIAKLVSVLISKKLLSCSNLENQALSLLRHTWQQNELLLIRDCIHCIRDLLKETYDGQQFSLMLEWISETLADIGYECDPI